MDSSRRHRPALPPTRPAAPDDRPQGSPPGPWPTGPIIGLIHGRPLDPVNPRPAGAGAADDSVIERLRRAGDPSRVGRAAPARPAGAPAVVRRIPAGITGQRTVRVLTGKYAGAVGTLYNWYPTMGGGGQYEVGFDTVPRPELRDLENFSPDDLEFVDDGQPTVTSATSKQEEDDPSETSADRKESSTTQSGRYRHKQWLVLIDDAFNGKKKGTRFQVDESIDSDRRVEVLEDLNHPYGGSYRYDEVEPAAEVPPGTLTSLAPPQNPASLPALGETKDGNRPFLEHPNRESMEVALASHGFTVEFSQTTADQHTQVIRFQEPERSAVGRRVVQIGPHTTYSDVEHEFTHVRQQTRWATTPGVGYLPTKTEQVAPGTLAEGRANAEDRELGNFVERSLGEVEAYGEELIRLHGRQEFKTGDLSLDDLARERFLRWLGDYIGLVNSDPAEAKSSFTLANDTHRRLFPGVENTVRTALKVVGELLGTSFKVPSEIIDRRN